MTPGDRLEGTTISRLVHAAAAGDRDAFVELVDGLGGVVWAQIRAHLLSVADADDVAQGVWLRLAQNLGRIREPEKLPGWLATTTRNECLVVLRRAARGIPLSLQAEAARKVVADVSETVEHHERLAAVREGLATLDTRCRELLSLLCVDPPIPYDQIGASLDMPVASIGPTRSRCIEKLRKTKGVRELIDSESDGAGPPADTPIPKTRVRGSGSRALKVEGGDAGHGQSNA